MSEVAPMFERLRRQIELIPITEPLDPAKSQLIEVFSVTIGAR